jgi:hypothetical protein
VAADREQAQAAVVGELTEADVAVEGPPCPPWPCPFPWRPACRSRTRLAHPCLERVRIGRRLRAVPRLWGCANSAFDRGGSRLKVSSYLLRGGMAMRGGVTGEMDGGGVDGQPASGRLGEGRGRRKWGTGGGRRGRRLWDEGDLLSSPRRHGGASRGHGGSGGGGADGQPTPGRLGEGRGRRKRAAGE